METYRGAHGNSRLGRLWRNVNAACKHPYTLLALMWIACVILCFGTIEACGVITCRFELWRLSTACRQYKTYSISNELPSDLLELAKDDSIPATESTDGIKHGNFIYVGDSHRFDRWTTAGLYNFWHKPYKISTADGTISCDTDAIIGTMSTEIGDKDQ